MPREAANEAEAALARLSLAATLRKARGMRKPRDAGSRSGSRLRNAAVYLRV